MDFDLLIFSDNINGGAIDCKQPHWVLKNSFEGKTPIQ